MTNKVFPIVAVLTLGFAAFHQGCYNPEIADGTLRCASQGKACPDGFQCLEGTCWKNGTTSGTGGFGGNALGGSGALGGAGGIRTGGAGGGDVRMGGAGGSDTGMGGANMCIGPLQLSQCAGVTPQTGWACDPTCQVGCGCAQRCNISDKAPVCVAPTGTKATGDVCTLGNGGRDECRPGTICLGEITAACQNHCYRYCKADHDCAAGVHCTLPLNDNMGNLIPNAFVCDVPPEGCDPVFGRAICLNRGGAFGCYISGSAYANEAVCDCAAAGIENSRCEYLRDCAPGLVCAPDSNTCRKVCSLANPGTLCGAASACVPYGTPPSTKYGYCRSP